MGVSLPTARVIFRRVTPALIFAVAALVGFRILLETQRRVGQPAGDPRPAPNFRLTERSGRDLSPGELRGRVWVAGFIFTRCKGPCPFLSARMARLQDRFKEEKDFRLVSFSVDPAFDTPQVLRGYARRFGADPDRWLFLTGTPDDIRELVVNGFRLAVQPEGTSSHQILHSTRLVLVDRQGQIRGYYEGTEAADLERLEREIKALL